MTAMPTLKSTPDAPSGPVSAAIERLSNALAPRWRAMAARERLGVTIAALTLGLLLLWQLGMAPALRTLRTVPAQRAELEAQLQVMQRQAAESRQLRQQPPITPGQAEAALKAATDQLGATARISVAGDRATITLDGTNGVALVAWLAEVRTAARSRVVDAQLTRKGAGYGGTIVLSLQRP
jgi:general secretion pathway protein M